MEKSLFFILLGNIASSGLLSALNFFCAVIITITNDLWLCSLRYRHGRGVVRRKTLHSAAVPSVGVGILSEFFKR